MNKILALLGLISLVAVSGLFFFAGFFTGSTVISPLSKKNVVDPDALPMSDVEKTINTESSSLSEKIKKILDITTGNERASSGHQEEILEQSQLSINALLKEIAASHGINDDCSVEKTRNTLSTPKQVKTDSLEGKRIVFIGYFKTNIAMQIQNLLLRKGYRVHVEESRTSNRESFVFCGPFRQAKTAEALVKWLNAHDFADARIIKVEKDSLEETLYDSNSDIPANSEQNIPEMSGFDMYQQQQQMMAQGMQQQQNYQMNQQQMMNQGMQQVQMNNPMNQQQMNYQQQAQINNQMMYPMQ